jgi:hypothetical protein
MSIRSLATTLALNRAAFGAAYLVAPATAGHGWIGRVADRPGAQVMIRGLGARDLALGVGALWALAAGNRAPRPWFAAHAVADGTDLVATLAARRGLRLRNLLFASGMAGASAAIAIAGARAA